MRRLLLGDGQLCAERVDFEGELHLGILTSGKLGAHGRGFLLGALLGGRCLRELLTARKQLRTEGLELLDVHCPGALRLRPGRHGLFTACVGLLRRGLCGCALVAQGLELCLGISHLEPQRGGLAHGSCAGLLQARCVARGGGRDLQGAGLPAWCSRCPCPAQAGPPHGRGHGGLKVLGVLPHLNLPMQLPLRPRHGRAGPGEAPVAQGRALASLLKAAKPALLQAKQDLQWARAEQPTCDLLHIPGQMLEHTVGEDREAHDLAGLFWGDRHTALGREPRQDALLEVLLGGREEVSLRTHGGRRSIELQVTANDVEEL
mmetsp:Transcript_10838/g.33872  ORF Transcript_10838/g.33872 Transcript_10838/m.33872 type:complete len:318 (+) Transcript_10838:894-1847(+)